QPQEAVMVAKRFFYLSAGLLCLALAYHLGAQSAKAQGQTVEIAGVNVEESTPGYAGTVGRIISTFPYTGTEPVPGTSPIVAVAYNRGNVYAELANGDCYVNCASSCGNPGWVRVGNVFGKTTPATQETWGEIKARYRAGAGAATQDN